jgi:DNA polymerase I
VRDKFYIIDGNSYMYRAFYAMPELTTSSGIHVNALYGFIKMILKIVNESKPDYLVVCFDSAKKTFRNDMYAEYKANRKKTPPELLSQIGFIKEFLNVIGIKQVAMVGFEADDLIASIVKNFEDQDLNIVIASQDKDIFQLINDTVKILNDKYKILDKKHVIEKYGIPPEDLLDYFSLMGDNSDNIPGVKGIGRVTALKLIKQYKSIDKILENIDSLNKKISEKILASINDLTLSKKLISLKDDISLSQNQKDFLVTEIPKIEFKTFLEKFELKKMVTEYYENNDLIPKREKIICKNVENFNLLENIKELNISFDTDNNIFLYVEGLGHFRIKANKRQDFFKFLNTQTPKIYTNNSKMFYKILTDVSDEIYIFDILLAFYLLHADKKNTLEEAAKYYLKTADFKNFDNKEEEFSYSAYIIYQIKEKIICELEEKGLINAYWNIELPLVKILINMENTGIKIDVKCLQNLAVELSIKTDQLENNIFTLCEDKFNIKSPKQLANILFNKLKLPAFEKNKTGFSTSEYALSMLKEYHPVIKFILQYREVTKLKATYVDVFPTMVDKKSRLHSTFNQTGTATGRLSSSNPNLQNIPIKTELGSKIRQNFIVDKGNVFLSVDYSQIDLVVLAHMSEDKNMIASFQTGQDIHKLTASQIFNIHINDVSNDMRIFSKRINFGIVYGISPFGLAKDTGISLKAAKDFIEKYFNIYSDVKEYIDKTIKTAYNNGYIKTLFGRIRYIPELKVAKYRKFGERIAVNTSIQGTSSDIIKQAMVNIYNIFSKQNTYNAKLVLQIHDELIFEVPETFLSSTKEVVVQKMEEAAKLLIPLQVNVKTGVNLASLK